MKEKSDEELNKLEDEAKKELRKNFLSSNHRFPKKDIDGFSRLKEFYNKAIINGDYEIAGELQFVLTITQYLKENYENTYQLILRNLKIIDRYETLAVQKENSMEKAIEILSDEFYLSEETIKKDILSKYRPNKLSKKSKS